MEEIRSGRRPVLVAAVDIAGGASPRSRAGSFLLLVILVALAAGLLTALGLHRSHSRGRPVPPAQSVELDRSR